MASDGHIAWLAHSADDALDRLVSEPTKLDVVLLDLVMPGMPAEAFASIVKHSAQWADVRIVLVTGLDDDEVPHGLLVDAVLHEPFRIERLLAVIRSVVTTRP